jgi:hypothetical protein
MKKITEVTLGSDAEFFVETLTGEAIPAIGMVGGTKAKPKPLGNSYYIQEDNVAVEFNIPPTTNIKAFQAAILKGIQKCSAVLPSAVRINKNASISFRREYIERIDAANEFGCEPDLNAWNRTVNPRPKSGDPFLRSAGAHIHIGWTDPDMEQRFELIKACDVFASIPSLWEDGDQRRRQLYGKAGAMRIKPYGVEHRVLSNYWLWHPDNAYFVGSRYYQAIDFLNKGHKIQNSDAEEIQELINKYDGTRAMTGMAQKIHNKYEMMLITNKKKEPIRDATF